MGKWIRKLLAQCESIDVQMHFKRIAHVIWSQVPGIGKNQ